LKRVQYRLQSGDGANAGGLLRSEEPFGPHAGGVAAAEPAGLDVAPEASLHPVLVEIQYLQFRYWTGSNWVDNWSLSGLPSAVEVGLGAEMVSNANELAESPTDIFRRIIYLPGLALDGRPSTVPAEADPAASEGEP
jgi:hypothetical protein